MITTGADNKIKTRIKGTIVAVGLGKMMHMEVNGMRLYIPVNTPPQTIIREIYRDAQDIDKKTPREGYGGIIVYNSGKEIKSPGV